MNKQEMGIPELAATGDIDSSSSRPLISDFGDHQPSTVSACIYCL